MDGFLEELYHRTRLDQTQGQLNIDTPATATRSLFSHTIHLSEPNKAALVLIGSRGVAHLDREVEREAPLVWSDVDVCIWETPGEGTHKDLVLVRGGAKHNVLDWFVQL